MNRNIKIYLGAAGSVLLPTAWQGCNGVCGSCGAGCMLAALAAGTAGLRCWRRGRLHLLDREEYHAKHAD